ncbi:GNAT superfamily N-acetyltransferase [Luteibacter sp. Sphag1AF]|uniref:GNAT family N-acetyltransferase n=1 Tax=Luteibacter sp. Sphag1AF TaxID=2587031 RepID=UPI00160D8323|nr:GNAT family N-acetyltransferase [Luteibacter sp. Sphag1AF]MBB3227176.1 GNAT superfamily N-acetyltransferase [Luteibacter sp. Sphag1AF]
MEKHELDIGLVHAFLSTQTAWAKGISRDIVERSIEHSLCFGGYLGDQQVAFARVTTDRATFAYLADVFVLPEHRGKGYSKRLMEAVMACPDLQGLRRFMLATSDAHTLYQLFGFNRPTRPETLMERYHPDVYTDAAGLAAINGTS